MFASKVLSGGFLISAVSVALFLGTSDAVCLGDHSIRLVGATVDFYGRVELCVNGTRGTICADTDWDNRDASVVCQQAGYSPYGSIALKGSLTEGVLQTFVHNLNCTGDEPNIWDCPHNDAERGSCDQYNDAAVICSGNSALFPSNCSDGDVRLVGGSNEFEGTVQVCINRVWGSVCSTSNRYYNYWNVNDGKVVCGQLGYQRLGSTVYTSTPFASVEGPSFLTNLGCSGSEESLFDCSKVFVTDDICSSHSRDVGVKCQPPCIDGSVRLVNTSVSPPTIHQGRVEICVNNTWGTVCDDFWDNIDASVICHQLGYSAIGSIAVVGRNGERTWPVYMNDVNCTGEEENIWECPHNGIDGYVCNHFQDASVICYGTDFSLSNCSDGDVRLVGGSNKYEGTVQVCINSVWGSVCSTSNRYYNYWNVDDGKVVCGQLGYQRLGSTVYTSTPFASVEGPSFLTNLGCSGSEESLFDCSKVFVTDDICSSHSRDVGVKCQPPCVDGSVRLVNTSVSPLTIHQGRVEICVNSTWGTVCDDFWDNMDASVICHQLGYSTIGSIAVMGRNGEGTWPVYINDVNCTGEEENIWECPHNEVDGYVCNHYQDASVICYGFELSLSNCSDGDVRLVGGSNEYEGTVQVCINRVWGSVCSTSNRYYNYWNVNDGKVVCGQLGYQRLGSTVYTSTPFGSVEGPSFVTNVGCSGSEESLLDCSKRFVTDDVCSSHSRDVGLKCQPPCVDGSVRLVNTSVSPPTIHQGRVEICVNNTWGTVCDDFWDNIDASVICHQLGYSTIGSIAVIGRNGERIWPVYMNDVNCTGDEENIWECPHNGVDGYVCNHYQDASVICYDVDLSLPVSNCSDGDVRLVGGSNEYEGTVEVCINRVWGSVCSSSYGYYYYYYRNDWDLNDAKVVCGQLGFQRFGATVYPVTPFSDGVGVVFLHSIGCSGNEATILDCRHNFVTDAHCFSHTRDVGIHCQPLCDDGSVRLASRDSSYFRMYGTIEVCENGTWGAICVDHWDDNDASVVCQQLGYSRYGAVAGIALRSVWPYHIEHLNCSGRENSYKQCTSVFGSTCSTSREAFVLCQYTDTLYSNCDTGTVRLVEGETNTSGIVEVCRNKAWGTICGNNWRQSQSRVVCRQLGFQDGYGSVLGLSSSVPRGKGRRLRLMYQLPCSGSESNISECSLQQLHSSNNLYSCDRYYSAAVSCIAPCNDGDVELFGAGIDRAGIVRVCVNNKWGKVCGNDVNNNELATVVCSQLGYSPFGAIAMSGLWYDYNYVYSLFDVSCSGNETSLLQCQHRSDSSRCSSSAVAVLCQQETTLVHPVECSDGSVRLTGDSTNRGTVEVCRNKAWGSICYGSGFSITEARVVCRQIGYPEYVGLYQILSSPQVPPMFTDFSCSSSELSLSACQNPAGITRSVSTCSVSVVGINCESQCVHNTLRLVGGPSANQGRVEVCGEGHWGKVCSDMYWDNTDAGVVCKQLGFSQYGAVALSGLYYDYDLIYLVHSLSCNGSEETILDCHRNFGSESCGVRDDASVSCRDSAVFSNCTDGEVILEGYNAQNIGQPKVCFNSFWGSICARYSYYWTAVDSNVVCRELGFQSAGAVSVRSSSVSYVLRPEQILPLRFNCRGSEEQLRDCPRYSLSSCGSFVAEIECVELCNEGDLRLTGSSNPLSGQVEVCVNQTWGTICAEFWNDNNTKVLCEQLGFSSEGVQTSSSYQNRVWPIHVNDFNCLGDEDTIWDCPRDQSQECSGYVRNAAVICSEPAPSNCTTSGDVRLRSGTSEYEGRVEMCLDGQWSTICNRNWGSEEAIVACRQLGRPTPAALATTVGGGFGPIYDTFHCTGMESNFINCSEPQSAPYYCRHSSDAGVVCQAPCEHGSVQLMSISGNVRTDYGILEMCVNGTWRRVCANQVVIGQAPDICRQLGHSKYGAVSVPYSLSNGQDQYVVFSCNGTEQMLLDCNYTMSVCSPTHSLLLTCQESDDDIVTSNCTNFDVRLTDGTSNTTGTVEVCINKHWSTLCRQHFDGQDASVVCSYLGYQRYGASTFIAQRTNRAKLLINRLGCSGTESRISDCSLQYRTESLYCSNLDVAGVTCEVNCVEGSMRITGSSSPSSSQGRVDVCISSQWSTLCGDFWTDSHAMVVCRQLGYSAFGSVPYLQRHQSLPVHSQNISCNGSEDTLLNCFQATAGDTCPSGHVAFVVCQNATIQSNCSNWDLRVPTMSTAKVEGRVELCYNKVWFSVFYTYQNVHTGRVMCRSLGYDANGGSAHELFSVAYLDRPYLPPFLFDLSCSSGSTELSTCMRSSPFSLNSYRYQVGVRCLPGCMSGDIRLAATPYNLYGRVEACVNGSWGTVCETSWDDRDASVVCRQSGFSPYGSLPLFRAYRTSSIPTLINSLNCTGQERSIFDCQQTDDCPTSYYDASIVCQDFETQYSNCSNGTLRIRGGPNDLEGRLEICLNNIWGTVCGSSWDNNDATVACRQLGHQPTGVITTQSFYGRGEGPSLYNFYCSGTEHSIFDCRHDKISAPRCGDGYVAGIKCQESCVEGGIQLRGSSTRRTGRVEVCIEQSWTTICDQLWNDRDATVICQQLGFSPIGAIPLRGQFSNRLIPLGINSLNCSGGESNWTECDYSLTSVGDSCNVLHSASVVCQAYGTQFSNCSDGDIRLSGSFADFEGVVEICINNAWGTICDSNWGTLDGNVVCRHLGFLSRGSNTNRRGVFGLLQGPIHLSNVRCAGDEESLLDCQHDKLGALCSSSHLRDAAVTCQVPCTPGDIRLAGRSDSQSGRVEVCINREWGTICDSHWSSIQASVVCQHLGYSQFGAVAVRGATYLQDSVWPTTIFQIDCDGNETALFQCRINQEIPLVCDGLDAAVVCQGPGTVQANCTDGEVRLVGGSSLNEGRVEMCYNSAWGTICDDYWNREEASIVCRQLGFQPNGAVPYRRAHFGQGSGPIYIHWISCSGEEATLLDCPRRAYDLNSCSHHEDAAVFCEELCVDGNIRITGTNLENIGRVEVCINSTWGVVCNDQWDDMDASVVCNQLGLSPHGSLSSQDFSRHNSDLVPYVNNVNCLGNETGLLNCSLNMLDSSVAVCNNAGIVCQENIEFSDCVSGQVRLSGGTVSKNGRVEMCINNAWGSICDRHWDINDGNLVCKQLGYQPVGSVPRYRSFFGSGSLPVIIGGLTCSGTEDELSQCDRDDRALLSCSEYTVAGVECEDLCDNGDLQLIGDSPYSGRVEICANRTWETVCSDMWDDVDASIVCRQLGHSAYGSMSGSIRISREARAPYRSAVQCSGNEETLNECPHVERRGINCQQATIAGVICQSIDVEVSNCTHGDLRLVGGRRSNDGRVEVCINNVWGTVCDRGWSREDANVACGQLGYYPSEASPKYGSFYGRGMGPIHFANLQCSSSNQRLIECNRDVFASTSCHHYRDAGVKCQGSFPIQLSKSYGSLLGGEIVTVSGINFQEDDTITCRFGDTMVLGDFLTSNEVACVTPAVDREGVADFELKVTRHPTVLFGGSSFRFISPLDIDDSIEVMKSDDLVWRVGDVANIAWSPSNIAGDLVEDSSIKVDIHLLTYDVVDEQLKEDTMLMSAVPNNGSIMIALPNVTSISRTEYGLETALLKISVNMSVSAFVSRKRSIFSNVGKILGKVLKFGKVLAIGYVKTSIASRLLCEAWRLASPSVDQQRLPPCPCRKDQALDDNRYVEETGAVAGFLRKNVFHEGSESCFRQANVRDFGPGQQCCFDDNGDIIPGSPNGGTADLVAPTNWKTIPVHFLVDVIPWVLCCTGLFKDCSRYYDRRSADDCEDYPDRPPPARLFGDPHIVTLDGYQYTFNGKGEFILLETSDEQFTLQGRMTDISSVSNASSPSNTSGTSFVALACKQIDSDTVQFEVIDGSLVAFVNGEETNFTDFAMLDFANVTLVKENDTLSARFSDGVVITADAKNGIISNIQVTIPDTFSSTRGLLGQYNGLEFDDLRPRGSSDVLSTNSSLRDIHYSFGITWIIDDPGDSIFTYSSSGSWDTYYQPLYQPIFEVVISDPILRIEAEAVCGDDQLCYFDIAATGNVDIGVATLDTVNDQKKVVALLKPAICDPPCVNGACTANDVCVCSAGYEGDLCELTVFEECNVSICENGGMCQIIAGDYRCECSEFFYGALCEIASERGPDVLVLALSSVGGVMGFTAVIICLSCILACGYSCYKKRVPKDKKSSKTVESKQEVVAMTNIYE